MPICTPTSSRSLCRSWRPSALPLLTTMTLIRCHGPFCDVTMSKKPQKVSISRCFPGLSNYSSIINRATIFLHIQQVLFAAGDVKVMSFFRNSSFFSRRHVLFSRIPLFELYGGRLSSVRIGYFLFFPMLVFPVFPRFSLASGCFCYLGVTSVLLSGSTKPSSTR